MSVPMLSSHQLTAIATEYARQYHAGNGIRPSEPVPDPPGMRFQVDRLAPLIGDAGFFVSAADGRVIQLGSGHFTSLLLAGVALDAEAGMQAGLQRILVEALARPAPPADRCGLRVNQ